VTAELVLGLGSNLGDRLTTLQRAVAELASSFTIVGKSGVYETPPLGPPQPAFLNAAVRIATDLEPDALHARLLDIERRLGRVRPDAVRWGPRTIDIDVLWCAAGPIASASLTVPHPRLHERAFAIIPLLDVAPEAPYATEETLPRVGEL
jgi:2-amino-4-hydroxy-6-hydroxymethyldihydropteridine diphosphokinase